jgi:hypothetical protein
MACTHSAQPAALFCDQIRPDGESGLNPLLSPDLFSCFDDAAACRRMPRRGSAEACRAVSAPDWHCYAVSSPGPHTDPLETAMSCLPSKAMCESSRPRSMAGDDAMRVGACAPAAAVYCHAGTESRGLMCYGDDATCQLTASMLAATLVGGESLTACARWNSAGPAAPAR